MTKAERRYFVEKEREQYDILCEFTKQYGVEDDLTAIVRNKWVVYYNILGDLNIDSDEFK